MIMLTVPNNNNSSIGTASGEIRERQFLFQRLSVMIQRFNSILLHISFVERDDPHLSLSRLLILAYSYLLTLGNFTTKGT